MKFDEIIKQITNKIENINAIYVFGSVLQEKYFTQNSDIDIAILADKILDKMAVFELKQELEYILKRDVDLVDFYYCKNYALVLAMQILQNGKVIYCKDDKKRLAFEDLVFCEYVRFQDLRADFVDNL